MNNLLNDLLIAIFAFWRWMALAATVLISFAHEPQLDQDEAWQTKSALYTSCISVSRFITASITLAGRHYRQRNVSNGILPVTAHVLFERQSAQASRLSSRRLGRARGATNDYSRNVARLQITARIAVRPRYHGKRSLLEHAGPGRNRSRLRQLPKRLQSVV